MSVNAQTTVSTTPSSTSSFSWSRVSTRPSLRPDALAVRVVERLGGHLACDPVAEDLDLDRRADGGAAGRKVGVGDRALDRVAEAAARHAAGDLAAGADRFRPERHGARVVEDETAELA